MAPPMSFTMEEADEGFELFADQWLPPEQPGAGALRVINHALGREVLQGAKASTAPARFEAARRGSRIPQ